MTRAKNQMATVRGHVFTCIAMMSPQDTFRKAVERKQENQLAHKIKKQRARRVWSGEDSHLHRKKDDRVRKRTRVDNRVGRGGSDKRPRSDYQ